MAKINMEQYYMMEEKETNIFLLFFTNLELNIIYKFDKMINRIVGEKMKKILLGFIMLAVFIVNVNAECNNEELNDWATKAEVEFTEVKELYTDVSDYAYILSVTPARDDIRLVVYDGKNDSANSEKYTMADGKEIIGVGCYTNLEEEKYTIEVYGAKGTSCENELLKKMDYSVERFNKYIKDARCKDSDSEYCKTFTNSTANMTEKEFEKALKKDIDGDSKTASEYIKIFLKYALFVVVPLAIVSVFYVIRIGKYQKQERDK